MATAIPSLSFLLDRFFFLSCLQQMIFNQFKKQILSNPYIIHLSNPFRNECDGCNSIFTICPYIQNTVTTVTNRYLYQLQNDSSLSMRVITGKSDMILVLKFVCLFQAFQFFINLFHLIFQSLICSRISL